MISTDVLIVGAGPTGLALAGELAAAGVSCAVLERRTAESNLTRAFAVHARTLEYLDMRGMGDELAATGAHVPGPRLFGSVNARLSLVKSRYNYLLITPQYQTEALLERWVRGLGVPIVSGAEVTGLDQDGDGVRVRVRTAEGKEETWETGYLAGTDGVHSTVRSALGLPFPGRSAIRSLMLADVRLPEPPAAPVLLDGNQAGLVFIAPFGDGWYRVITWDRDNQPADDAPLDFEQVRVSVRDVLGTDLGMREPRWISRFHSDERQVPHYRVGRVLLAGDAAHCHSPAGGQGMNIGIQDAANLGWKLAATVRGQAPTGLLDSYHDERHPVGRAVLRGSGALLRSITIPSPAVRAVRNRAIETVLNLSPAHRRLAELVSGIGTRYPAPRGAHPAVGRRAPDVPLAGGGRLYEVLRAVRFVLLGPDPAELDAAVRGWDDRVVTAATAGGDWILVRPDGYTAWAGRAGDRAGLRAGLAAWCGASAGAADSGGRARE
ncbi:FAD-dependent monooxygenase [Allonocardiopsis opalescens]|uniref:2-polyprenyl-6-methoxyphenol hydroxylase-like FAD-dependent oxidoreductase n=1 Tax=Allonocardiopsis opalescens TaxID=1144618 RepID=A0A2T0QEI7_9ACTN|nr:FAD-dependent monooxygenase [Allonocardiopsis opalescens]PRY02263.1 2-polyprenyl-6-methoxyphenol hydroxylase-like FAD-dependent oxidoreductase [Allonocardiopsis opalescens]